MTLENVLAFVRCHADHAASVIRETQANGRTYRCVEIVSRYTMRDGSEGYVIEYAFNLADARRILGY